MNKVVYQAWTEWDFGLSDKVFATKEGAWEAIKKAHASSGIEESYEDCLADGLYSVEVMKVED